MAALPIKVRKVKNERKNRMKHESTRSIKVRTGMKEIANKDSDNVGGKKNLT